MNQFQLNREELEDIRLKRFKDNVNDDKTNQLSN
jgi:hypothetical protein